MRRLTSGMLYMLLVVLLALPSLLTGCQAVVQPVSGRGSNDEAAAETLSVSGAFALFPLMTIWADAYHAQHNDINFDVQAGGAGKGMTDMLSGAADIAMLSREPREEELAQGSFLVPVVIDSVLGTVNANNPYLEELLRQGMTAEEANGIWISGRIRTWGDLLGNGAEEPINVYTRADASGAGEMWALFSHGEAQEELQGTAVNGDPGVAEAVRQDPFGVGYNNVGFTYDQATGEPIEGLRAVPLDLNGNDQIDGDEAFYHTRDAFTAAVAAGHYPFPPARTLYLVTRGEPDPAIAAFYRWVLTEGQGFVSDAGYVSLTEARIQEALDLVGE